VSALVAQSGVDSGLGRTVLGLLPIAPGQDITNFTALVGMSTMLSLITTTVGVPAVLAPFASELATAAHWPLLTVLMTQVIGYSTVLFPYQAPPLVLAMQLGGVPPATGIRVTLTLAALTLLILTPLNYMWWRLLGSFG
jgi:di/tricarboxylate transporter